MKRLTVGIYFNRVAAVNKAISPNQLLLDQKLETIGKWPKSVPFGSHSVMSFQHPTQKCAFLADSRQLKAKPEMREAISHFSQLLEEQGIHVTNFVGMPVEDIKPPEDLDMFVVMGGDGSMIHFAGPLSTYDIPFYGLNYGNVGFMMNNPLEGLQKHVSKLKEGAFMVHSFPLLEVEAEDLNGQTHRGIGLNDIYLQRMTPQSCKVNITLNDHSLPINPLLCDGVIVATPLGSTAYSYNVTGSMASIGTDVMILTPVAAARSCPVSSMMLPLGTKVTFDILEPEKRGVQVVSDGQNHGNVTFATIQVSERLVKLCFDQEYAKTLPMRFIAKACGGGF